VSSTTRRIIVAALIAAVALYVAAFVAVLVVSRQDQRHPADAIVVLGAAQYNGKPSPVLRARLDHAVALYREGLAATVVVTGGIGEGDRVSEATVAQEYLVAHGIPADAVIVRPEGRSTLSSMRSVAEWARGHGVRRVLLVSDPFHMLRLRLEAARNGLEAWTSPTDSSPISAHLHDEAPFLAAEALKIPVVLLRLP
jgi:uncharacterized SAM-binding protein YcdF (DUF218 family)